LAFSFPKEFIINNFFPESKSNIKSLANDLKGDMLVGNIIGTVGASIRPIKMTLVYSMA